MSIDLHIDTFFMFKGSCLLIFRQLLAAFLLFGMLKSMKGGSKMMRSPPVGVTYIEQ